MITDTYDPYTEAIINPHPHENLPLVDACIMTFSYIIENYVLQNFPCEQIATLISATGPTPVWQFVHQGKKIAFYKTYVGAPAAVGLLEDSLSAIRCDKYVLFGGAGCLNKEIAHGKVMIPTEAYRDEGTSYHYAPPSDYIAIPTHGVVAAFMEKEKIPYVLGKTWTTDAFYRETRGNFAKRKADGCISVEMECAGVQAACNHRGLALYPFFTSGDLLDAPKWDTRGRPGTYVGTQHDTLHFDIALALAVYVTNL